jgi:hypothetical protein
MSNIHHTINDILTDQVGMGRRGGGGRAEYLPGKDPASNSKAGVILPEAVVQAAY